MILKKSNSGFRLTGQQVVLLDIIRAVAASAVIFHHMLVMIRQSDYSRGLDLGSFGVTIFFLLSGFLIDQATRKKIDDPDFLHDYLIERISRIYVCFVPALIFTAAIAFLVSGIPTAKIRVEQPFESISFLGNLLMLQEYPLFQILRRLGLDSNWFIRPYPLGEPYWTIPIELFLYIVFGVVLFVFKTYEVRRRLTGILMTMMTIALVPVIYHAASGFGQCLTITWLVGVLVSRIITSDVLGRMFAKLEVRGSLAIIAFIVLAMLMLVLRQMSRGGSFYDLQKSIFMGMMLLGLLMLAPNLSKLDNSIVKAVSNFFAKTSYALYLTHNAIIALAIAWLGNSLSFGAILALTAVCYGAAYLFWWTFDRHYKKFSQSIKSLSVQRYRISLW